MDNDVVDRFVASWGMMGSVWGVNTSVARVHALLITSDEPLSLDDISERLKISRGNANTCLRELRNWAVICLVKKPGDRRDYYVSESDIWRMSFAIMRGRKKREFDPTLRAVMDALSSAKKGSSKMVEKRLEEMAGLLNTMDNISEKLLANEALAKKALTLLTVLAGKR
ncbi:MAG: transcriptional regulator [Deltaproteobacteria bacterium]|nr:transcriptional regulator [Deltaproteobacteria bacterium]